MKALPPLATLLLWFFAGCAGLGAAEFDLHHREFTQILASVVRTGRVDYARLKQRPEALHRYLNTLASLPRAHFDRWPEPDRIAFLINAYNAFTLRLIVDHYPVRSIKDIGSVLRGPWSQPVVTLFGGTLTLDEVEHQQLRKQFNEPRIHFALVCGAKGCPPLRTEAYSGTHLQTQLDDQARRFLADTEKNRIDLPARTLHLSPIFKWFSTDFERHSGSIPAALRPYWPNAADLPPLEGFAIRYTDYDWTLNDTTAKRAAD